MLGQEFEVRNFGFEGATVTHDGATPYTKTPQFHQTLKHQPDVVLIQLGTYDSQTNRWSQHWNFDRLYKWMAQRFQGLASKPVLYLLKPTPAFIKEEKGVNGTIIEEGILLRIDGIASRLDALIIDLQTPFVNRAELFPNQILPNTESFEKHYKQKVVELKHSLFTMKVNYDKKA